LKEGSKLASEVENLQAILQQDSNKQVLKPVTPSLHEKRG
jgi:hypothetical protein